MWPGLSDRDGVVGMTELVNGKGEVHPIKERHPWGEDRFWCSCGRPAYVDDVSFHAWHTDDGSPANCRVKTEAKDAARKL